RWPGVLPQDRDDVRRLGMSGIAIRVEGLDQSVQLGVRSSRTWRALKSVASLTHRLAAANPRLASWYLSLYRSLQLLPDGHWKEFVLNSIQSVRWPTIPLPPARVRLVSGLEAWVVPHLGEFDFTAHICRGYNYESETAAWFRG